MDQDRWYAPPAAPIESLPDDRAYHADLQPAGFWVRFGARAVDAIVGAAVGVAGAFIAGIVLAILQRADLVDAGWVQRVGKTTVGSFLASAVGTFAYHVASEWIGGATIGKAIFGLRVCRPDGTRCSLGGAVIRSLAYYIDSFFFGLVAYSVMSKSPLQQRLGDQWGKTAVFKAASLAPGARPGSAVGVGILVGGMLWILQACVSTVLKAM